MYTKISGKTDHRKIEMEKKPSQRSKNRKYSVNRSAERPLKFKRPVAKGHYAITRLLEISV